MQQRMLITLLNYYDENFEVHFKENFKKCFHQSVIPPMTEQIVFASLLEKLSRYFQDITFLNILNHQKLSKK